MLQILLIMLFQISLIMLIIILFMFVIVIIILLYHAIANSTVDKCCSVKLQDVFDNITHVMLYYYKVFIGHCIVNIVKSDAHVNEVSFGISVVLANAEKPR